MRPGLGRRLATGTNAALVAVLFAATVAVLVDLAQDHRVRWDLSADAVATLAPGTLAVLDRLEDQAAVISVTAFSAQQKGSEAQARDRSVRDLLRELELRSPRLHTRFVDFDADRLTAEGLGVRAYGTIVVEGRGDRVDIAERDVFRRRGADADFMGEAQLTRAIGQVLADAPRVAYLLTGHGERSVEDGGPSGLSELSMALDRDGWSVSTLDLLRRAGAGPASVPEDATIVLCVGPSAPLTPEEEGALRSYLGRGGRLAMFIEPGGFVPQLVEQAGAHVPAGVVLDEVGVFPYEDRPLLRYGSHPITDRLREGGISTLVANAAPVVVTPADGLRATTLLETSRSGWVERGDDRPPAFTPEVDLRGPVVVAAALELRPPHPLALGAPVPARLVVIGDADLVSNELLREAPGNATFAANTARWLGGDDRAMAGAGRPGRVRRLALSRSQLANVRLLVLVLLPLAPALGGVAVILARRRR